MTSKNKRLAMEVGKALIYGLLGVIAASLVRSWLTAKQFSVMRSLFPSQLNHVGPT